MERKKVERVVNTLFHGIDILAFYRGVSGTIVVVVKNEIGKNVLKLGDPSNLRNTIQQELQRRNLLLPYLGDHLPGIISFNHFDGMEVMQIDYAGDYNLHQIVTGGLYPDNIVETVFSEILEAKRKLWLGTLKPFDRHDCLRDYGSRAAELAGRLNNLVLGGKLVSDMLDLPVVVNGVLHPSFGQFIDQISHYQPPRFSCISHGDLNGDNIILSDENKWFLVDWEWVGRHDWIESVSRICGWWQVMATSLVDVPQLEIDRGCIKLSYQLEASPLVHHLMSLGRELGSNVARDLQEDHYDQKLAYFSATYYLRDLKFQPLRGRSNFVIPVIGEAFKALFPSA